MILFAFLSMGQAGLEGTDQKGIPPVIEEMDEVGFGKIGYWEYAR